MNRQAKVTYPAVYLGGPDHGRVIEFKAETSLSRYQSRAGAIIRVKRGDTRLYGRVTGKNRKGLYVRRDLDGHVVYEWVTFDFEGWPIRVDDLILRERLAEVMT